jgi:hypothetical protein
MAASAWKFYDVARQRLADGSYDLDNHSFKIALFTASSDCADTSIANQNYSDLTNEVANGNGYATGGVALSATWTRSGSTVTFDCAPDPSWTASGSGFAARHAVIYNDSHAQDGLLCTALLDTTPADVTVNASGTLTIEMAASGIFTLSGAN